MLLVLNFCLVGCIGGPVTTYLSNTQVGHLPLASQWPENRVKKSLINLAWRRTAGWASSTDRSSIPRSWGSDGALSKFTVQFYNSRLFLVPGWSCPESCGLHFCKRWSSSVVAVGYEFLKFLCLEKISEKIKTRESGLLDYSVALLFYARVCAELTRSGRLSSPLILYCPDDGQRGPPDSAPFYS